MKNLRPIAVCFFLLLPLLYVASYFALVTPGDRVLLKVFRVDGGATFPVYHNQSYRFGGEWAERVYWPLEQIDRKLRPRAWDDGMRADWG